MNSKPEILKNYVDNLLKLMQAEDTEVLDEIVARYPFFQTVHLLRIIRSNQRNGIFEQDLLSRTAVYAGSRAKLLNHLKSGFFSSQKAEIPEKELSKEIILPPPTTEQEIVDSEVNISQELTTQKEEEKTSRREMTESIIDKFIREQPSIQRPVVEFYSASEMAAKSLVEDDELATETLAQIFMKQENYRKAIRIYEKLSLLYPEKSNKFALLIENAKNKMTE